MSEKKKILIVEDDAKILKALTIRLKAEGYDVLGATDGMSGTAMARKEQPDLLLLDISMPAGGGFGVAQNVSNMAPLAGTPMVFMTASKQPGLKDQAEKLGAAGFIEKPFDTDTLLTTIRDALSQEAGNELPW